jgi:hypothetical protein
LLWTNQCFLSLLNASTSEIIDYLEWAIASCKLRDKLALIYIDKSISQNILTDMMLITPILLKILTAKPKIAQTLKGANISFYPTHYTIRKWENKWFDLDYKNKYKLERDLDDCCDYLNSKGHEYRNAKREI